MTVWYVYYQRALNGSASLAHAQFHQSQRSSHTQSMEVDKVSIPIFKHLTSMGSYTCKLKEQFCVCASTCFGSGPLENMGF